MSELLTDAEHRAMDLTVELWNTMVRDVVGDTSGSREADLRELAAHLHAIQQAVLSQAAGRAYPDRYRLLGGSLVEAPVREFALLEMSLDVEPSIFPGCGPPEVIARSGEELSAKAVYEKYAALPARDRWKARWVMSRSTLAAVCALDGRPKPTSGGSPVLLVGLPVDFDDTAVGMELRTVANLGTWSPLPGPAAAYDLRSRVAEVMSRG